jgi:hypothetical protein
VVLPAPVPMPLAPLEAPEAPPPLAPPAPPAANALPALKIAEQTITASKVELRFI